MRYITLVDSFDATFWCTLRTWVTQASNAVHDTICTLCLLDGPPVSQDNTSHGASSDRPDISVWL